MKHYSQIPFELGSREVFIHRHNPEPSKVNPGLHTWHLEGSSYMQYWQCSTLQDRHAPEDNMVDNTGQIHLPSIRVEF